MIYTLHQMHRWLLVGFTTVLAAALSAGAMVTIESRVLSGQQAPGADPGVVFNSVGNPVINGNGQVAFTSFVAGPNVTTSSNTGVWSEGSGVLDLVARAGSVVPGLGPDIFFQDVRQPSINDAGQVAFRGSISGTGVIGTNNLVIWLGGAGSLDLVARTGDPAPDAGAGVTFAGLDGTFMAINNAGHTPFEGRLTGLGVVAFTNDRGIWFESGGSSSLVARGGNPAPNTGAVFGSYLFSPVINSSDQIAISAGLAGAGINSGNDGGIWSGGTASLSLVARKGDAAPDTNPGQVFSAFNLPGINDAGRTVFNGFLTGTGVDSTNNSGIWTDSLGTLQMLARTGEQAAGLDPGVVYSLVTTPMINSLGEVSFGGMVSGTGIDFANSIGLWVGQPGAVDLIARSGDPAPDTEPGITYGAQFFNGLINGVGQVAYKADLSDFSKAIYATDLNGVHMLVARTGQQVDVNNDPLVEDLRTITSLDMVSGSGGDDGKSNSFNDAGQLAFRLFFSDGSNGIFVASTQAPLPGDLDGDGFVGLSDLDIVLNNWNQNVPPADSRADPSGDGFVGLDDLDTVLQHWNEGTPPSADNTIPEPTALAVLLAGAGFVQGRGPRPT